MPHPHCQSFANLKISHPDEATKAKRWECAMALDSSKTVDKKPLPPVISVQCVSAATRRRGVTRSRVKSAEVRVSSSKRRRRGLPKIAILGLSGASGFGV